ncbi:MAG TPA: hypothetical protein VIX17_16015 [Pyrinomonadaceae bacterium]|jgi:hypothetical protein
MRRRVIVSLFLLTLVVALRNEQIDAQPQDRLGSTLDLLKRKLETHLSYSLSEGQGPEVGSSKFEAVSFENCRVAWRSSSEVAQDNTNIPPALRNVRIVNNTSVDLSWIDPDKSRIYTIKEMVKRNLPRALVLELKIRSGSPGFKQQLVTTAGGRVTRNALEEKSYSFFFNTNDQPIAEEVSKAFAEAVSICRSRNKQ